MARTPTPRSVKGLSSAHTHKGQLQRAAYGLLTGARHLQADPPALPTNLRFMFYELEHDGIVSKPPDGAKATARTDAQDLSAAVMVLRELGMIPWEWIVDETRSLDTWTFAATVHRYITDRVDEARIDCWAGESPPLIICESRSLAGVLRRIAGEYLCPVAATNGQAGGFLHTDLLPYLAEHPGSPVLYLGDFDLAGGHIEANTRAVLERKAGGLDWRRVAITDAQVHGLGLRPLLKVDKRFRGGKAYEAWETEALQQAPLQELLRAALNEFLPEPLPDVLEREQEQRDEMHRRLGSAA